MTLGIPRVARYSQYRQAIFVPRGNRFATLVSASRQNFGGEIKLDSNSGLIRPDKGTATFVGDVVITTSDGIQVTTDLLNTSLEEIRGDTPGQVDGTGVIGTFSAGRMQFGTEKKDGPVHILFTDGVKLVYEPTKAER